MQYLKMLQRNHIILLIILGCLVMFAGSAIAGDMQPPKTSNGEPSMGYVKITATIMEINAVKSYMVIAEKPFLVFQSEKATDKKHKTELLDENGNAAKFGSFAEGQRVLASGTELPDGTIIAERIKRLASKRR